MNNKKNNSKKPVLIARVASAAGADKGFTGELSSTHKVYLLPPAIGGEGWKLAIGEGVSPPRVIEHLRANADGELASAKGAWEARKAPVKEPSSWDIFFLPRSA